MSKKTATVHASGKRKRAVARATVLKGTGRVTINNLELPQYGTQMTRLRISEPLVLAGDVAKQVDIKVRVEGGGASGQADAVRLAIGRALAEHDKKLRQVYLEYDRQLLVADVRRKEASKPNSHGKARAKRQKSYR